MALAMLGLAIGSVHVPIGEVWSALFHPDPQSTFTTIVRQVRLPQVITAATAGAGLAASGLLMQTLFRNPLAGPSVLGISSGASLGVALVMLSQPLWILLPIPRDLFVILASLAGAIAVLFLIVLADKRVGDGVTLLIIGLMVGYLCSAVISVLQSASAAQALKSYVLWGMGSFAAVDPRRIAWLVVPVMLGVVGSIALIKPLNALLLGDDYARSMGVPVDRTRRIAIWTTGLLAGTITAFCGPIAFLGLATPHVARMFVRTNDHAVLMPASILLGAVLALGCDLIVRASGTDVALPLNAVTSLLGAPVVLWVLLSGKHWARGN
ncbi:MAG: iron ABC transporter permease [Flavobacteriales bacterium]|nr:iron ABC transporter permease [Flavobacteriales bacterium]